MRGAKAQLVTAIFAGVAGVSQLPFTPDGSMRTSASLSLPSATTTASWGTG